MQGTHRLKVRWKLIAIIAIQPFVVPCIDIVCFSVTGTRSITRITWLYIIQFAVLFILILLIPKRKHQN